MKYHMEINRMHLIIQELESLRDSFLFVKDYEQ
jgi:hypothetical protein